MILKTRGNRNNCVTLQIPLFLVWILVAALFLLLLPVWLISTLAAFAMGYGWIGLSVIFLTVNTLWHLKGLEIEVESPKEMVFMKFI